MSNLNTAIYTREIPVNSVIDLSSIAMYCQLFEMGSESKTFSYGYVLTAQGEGKG
jgi:hypothetical protein